MGTNLADAMEVVISGVAGVFPDSQDLQQFGAKLLGNKYLVQRYDDLSEKCEWDWRMAP